MGSQHRKKQLKTSHRNSPTNANMDDVKLKEMTILTYVEKNPEIQPKSSQIPLVPRRADEEREPQPSPYDFPEGGLRAWLVAAGTAGILFCTLGYSNSFGVFQAYYIRNQLKDHSPDDISWIGSLQVFLVFALGLAGGPIFDRYGAWVSKAPPEPNTTCCICPRVN